MRIVARILATSLALTTLPVATVHAQAPAKTPMQQASPIVDTLAARLNKLVRDIDAAGADMPKVRGLLDKSKADNERLESQLAAIKAAMTDGEKAELEVYVQLKFGKAPDKLKGVVDKAQKDAAEAAAKVGPATVAKYRETIAKLGEEGAEHVKHIRDAGQDAQKREAAWQKFLSWDAKRHETMHQIQHDPNVMEPKTLVAEADAATQQEANHATRLYRLGARATCAELQKELARLGERVKPILELEPQFLKAPNATARRMAEAQLAEAKTAALEMPENLTQDEAEELRDAVLERIAPMLRKIEAAKK